MKRWTGEQAMLAEDAPGVIREAAECLVAAFERIEGDCGPSLISIAEADDDQDDVHEY